MPSRSKAGRSITDGRRKRRHSADPARRRWYAFHRTRRFMRHFGIDPDSDRRLAA